MATEPDPVKPPATFAEWREFRQLTDAQIADEITRSTGVEVRRGMIGALARGERNAGPVLAVALSRYTGLPVEQFMLPAINAAAVAPAQADDTEAA